MLLKSSDDDTPAPGEVMSTDLCNLEFSAKLTLLSFESFFWRSFAVVDSHNLDVELKSWGGPRVSEVADCAPGWTMLMVQGADIISTNCDDSKSH